MLLTDDSPASQLLSTKIPRTLTSVQNRLTDIFSWSNFLAPFASITTIFAWLGNFSLPTFSSVFDSRHGNLKLNMDENELKKLMAHIDGYIDTVISNKFVDNNQIISNQFEKKLTLTIANTINENLATGNHQLNDLDIDLIAEKVRVKLAGVLSQLNDEEQQSQILNRVLLKNDKFLSEVQKLVLHEHHKHNLVINNQPVDIDEIIRKILSSDNLLVLIDGRMKEALNRISLNEQKIEDIKVELSKLKVDISSKFSGFKNDFTAIRGEHNSFIGDFDSYKLSTDAKLKQLLLDIDLKLKESGDSYYASIDKSVRKNLVTILGIQSNGAAGEINDVDLKSWIQNMFVAKDYLEMRLKDLESKSNINFKSEIDESGGIMMQKINDKIQEEIMVAVNAKSKHYEALGKLPGSIGTGLDVDEVRRIVREVLAIYDADKTGLVDFALESAGGQVLSTRCTESYQMKSAEISIFGIPLWYPSNTPRTVISPSVQPGECWAFQGFPGFLVMQLNNKVYVTGFTLEHIPKSLSPNGHIDSAPYNFSVWVRFKHIFIFGIFIKYLFITRV